MILSRRFHAFNNLHPCCRRVAAGFAIARSQPDLAARSAPIGTTVPQMIDASNQPAFTGRAVKIYCRGSDNLPYPEMTPTKAGQISMAMNLTYFKGIIKKVQAGWIELAAEALRSGGSCSRRRSLQGPFLHSRQSFCRFDKIAPELRRLTRGHPCPLRGASKPKRRVI